MEGGVEDSHLWYTRQSLFHSVDAGQIARNMQWKYIFNALNQANNLIRHYTALLEVLATENNAITHSTNLLQVADNADSGVGESPQHNLDARSVVRNRQLLVMFLSVELMGKFAHSQTNAFQHTFGHHHSIVVHVHQLVLYR